MLKGYSRQPTGYALRTLGTWGAASLKSSSLTSSIRYLRIKRENLSPVIYFGYAPLLILANPSFPPKNPQELLNYLKANPGKVNWGSSGKGSSLHIGLAVFQLVIGTQFTH